MNDVCWFFQTDSAWDWDWKYLRRYTLYVVWTAISSSSLSKESFGYIVWCICKCAMFVAVFRQLRPVTGTGNTWEDTLCILSSWFLFPFPLSVSFINGECYRNTSSRVRCIDSESLPKNNIQWWQTAPAAVKNLNISFKCCSKYKSRDSSEICLSWGF